jgi:hypothetical protein
MAVGVLVALSMEEVSVWVSAAVALVPAVSMVALTVALWLPDMLEAESGAAVVESALAERTLHVAFRTLPARGPGSLHLVIHHPGNLFMRDGLIDPFLPVSRPIMPRRLQQRVHRKHFRNAEWMGG